MAQHARPRIADNGWRLPRDWRKSGMSEKTSMSRWGCAIMTIDLDERVLGQRGVPVKQSPTWTKTLYLLLGLIGNPFPKTEWPCSIYYRIDPDGIVIVRILGQQDPQQLQ